MASAPDLVQLLAVGFCLLVVAALARRRSKVERPSEPWPNAPLAQHPPAERSSVDAA